MEGKYIIIPSAAPIKQRNYTITIHEVTASLFQVEFQLWSQALPTMLRALTTEGKE